MSQTAQVVISCHCGAEKQVVALRMPDSQGAGPADIDLCHCATCRHSSGLLCVSYAPVHEPKSLAGLAVYPDSPSTAQTQRYFCNTCGCHVFRRSADRAWAVATGVIVGRAGGDGEVADSLDEEKVEGNRLLTYARHVNTAGTRDGGLSPFIGHANGSHRMEVFEHWPTSTSSAAEEIKAIREGGKGDGEDVLNAHCHCGTIRFHITRPDASSRLPRSNFPDLTNAYVSTPQEIIANPHNEKWWLQPQGAPNPTKYLAGTCACRSCRVTAGFEIQTWAFVPRSNIFFHPPSPAPASSSSSSSTTTTANPEDKVVPLDFTTLHSEGIPLKSYESSPGVVRESCPRCGATVFWHDRWRPELIDVSVGLLDAAEGARAGNWLEWWCERVSFEEDAGNGRVGEVASLAKGLIRSLEDGLRSWGKGRGKES
ncbi:hypothetical protein F5Y04DRAFT_277905 [Hypomontagnella monticulosa]|nr:hypothetical protein F5Y04DRAFT_277905 [Hypomontagnella monticulosa]